MPNGNAEHRAIKVEFSTDAIHLILADGRRVRSPLKLYPTLTRAKPKERGHYRLVGGGLYIHWPDLDLDLETEQIVLGEHEQFPRPPAIPPKHAKGGDPNFHVRFEKRRGWVITAKHNPFKSSYRTKQMAQAEALSLGRMMGLSDVYIHRKTGKLERIVSIEKRIEA
ncbi:MAG: DUF2442 domain-containing protein [Planctomycetes bacterium]|nr:DUF2442 domain-containing protein [Planctomycetota bacterium]